MCVSSAPSEMKWVPLIVPSMMAVTLGTSAGSLPELAMHWRMRSSRSPPTSLTKRPMIREFGMSPMSRPAFRRDAAKAAALA